MAKGKKNFHGRLLCGAAAIALLSWSSAQAQDAKFNIAPQSLDTALREFGVQSGVTIMADAHDTLSKQSPGFSATADPETALKQLLAGTGLSYRRSGDVFVVSDASDPQSGSAAGGGADAGTVQALIVTAQKREENIQDVPIAMSAFTQEALERSQVAGGPDLMTQVPNMTFTKTNFSSYSIQIRGIGTQAISATTDAAVAVAFNNTPFIRNRFFEQEFYDLQRVEVLRGPQGTLYGRNATAGVVNIISQKPKFTYEAKLSADVANYSSSRLEGMLNIPLVEDKVALRIAGAWTKRDGYDTNQISGNQIDGRDLWSTRLSLRVAPTDKIDVNLIWEHFEENDDRLRSGKQLCRQDDRETVGGLTVDWSGYSDVFSQGCVAASLYSPDSFEAPNGYSLPYFLPLPFVPINHNFNPYASLVQSPDLRTIESTIDPKYTAKSDLVELQWTAAVSDGLTLASETSYNNDTIFSKEDYNRFNTAHGAFKQEEDPGERSGVLNGGVFCDPQLGCSDRLLAVDVSRAKSRQFSQEFRLSSDYDGPFNFSLGANFLRYDTEDKYYVFINTLSFFAAMNANNASGTLSPYQPGITDNTECLGHGLVPPDPRTYQILSGCIYLDPNPIENVNDLGHNYFLSRNPYKLISYAAFGEAYYNISDNLKLTAGLRWTVDKKEAPRIPSWVLAAGTAGYSVLAVEEQEWREPTGRLTLDWKPDLAFTDETLLYASFAHGYKAGGSNPPPSGVVVWDLSGLGLAENPEGAIKVDETAAKPKIFDPEFVNAFELGAKNTMLDGRLTLNLAGFYYDYKGYQVSQIIDRSAVNYNFDSKIWGLEVEADWRPVENLRLGFKGGYENTRIADGERAIDIMDRTAGHQDWIVVRPFPSFPSNCILPAYVFDRPGDDLTHLRPFTFSSGFLGPCEYAYTFRVDPVTLLPFTPNPTQASFAYGYPAEPIGNIINYPGYPGYNPDLDVGQNNGEGFYKELGGNELPNAPHFTATVTADYTLPLPSDWLMTLHTDLYYQSEAWTRVFNTPGYDKLKAYTNVNLAAIFTNEDAGWKIMAYVKNVMDRDSITGAFLNSDDTGLTTNVFLTEPRLYGLRVTKEWTGGPWWTGAGPNHTGPYPLTVELGGQVQRQDAPYASVAPDFVPSFSAAIDPTAPQHRDLDWGDGREVKLIYRPGGGVWSLAGSLRYGRSNNNTPLVHASEAAGPEHCAAPSYSPACDRNSPYYQPGILQTGVNWSDSSAREREEHVVADFSVGRDVGLGLLGGGRSSISAGLRYAEFKSTTRATMSGIPDLTLPDIWFFLPTSRHAYRASLTADREFDGLGPTLSWDASRPLVGDDASGHLDLDWALTAGVLFGRQKSTLSGSYEANYVSAKYTELVADHAMPPLTAVPLDVAPRSKSVTVPVVDLSLGLSYEVQRFKVGAGYRWERYFNVLDAGYAERKQYDRTIDGPYFKIAVGFGG